MNKKGLALCEKERSYNYMNVKDLEDQGDKFRLGMHFTYKTPFMSKYGA